MQFPAIKVSLPRLQSLSGLKLKCVRDIIAKLLINMKDSKSVNAVNIRSTGISVQDARKSDKSNR